MTAEEFYRQAVGVLQKELGADGLARFLRLSRSGGGDYTRDREQWLGRQTVEEIRQSIASHKRSGSTPLR